MRKLALCALMVISVPASGVSDIDDALNQVPTLKDLCGAVPTAPTKVRGSSVHRPVRREVKTFIKATNDWLDCATGMYVEIQSMINAMQDQFQRRALVGHLNRDFRDRYNTLNEQTRLLATRVNYRMTWEVRPFRPSVDSSGRGLSSSKANVLLRKAKKLTFQSDINRAIHDPSPELFQ